MHHLAGGGGPGRALGGVGNQIDDPRVAGEGIERKVHQPGGVEVVERVLGAGPHAAVPVGGQVLDLGQGALVLERAISGVAAKARLAPHPQGIERGGKRCRLEPEALQGDARGLGAVRVERL